MGMVQQMSWEDLKGYMMNLKEIILIIAGTIAIIFALIVFVTIPSEAFPTGSYPGGDSTIAVYLFYLFGALGIICLGTFGVMKYRQQRTSQ